MSQYQKPEVEEYGTVESMTEYHKEGNEIDEHNTNQDRSSSI